MKRIAILPIVAVLALGAAACSKTSEPTNTTTLESNTIVEEPDANLSAVDGIDTTNSEDLLNVDDGNTTTNTL